MRAEEAKVLVVSLMLGSLRTAEGLTLVDAVSPDGDPAKFMIAGKIARAIHHFDGWFVPINRTWFSGSYDQPVINKTPFYWYVFAVPARRRYRADHYVICDYLQVREWVMAFAAPLGNDHRDHKLWRCDLRLYPDERAGYFRWGDEPPGRDDQPGRVFEVDNLATAGQPAQAETAGAPAQGGQHVGLFGPGGESAAHRLLKFYVAGHPLEFGLSAAAIPHVEYSFTTGDRVDVMFENHLPDRTVVEIEVEGEQQLCIGVHQAIKYRSLAAADAGFPLLTSRVRSVVVAYSIDYPKVRELAERYDIPLLAADRETVLGGAR
jgi:hypothetical protein